MGVLYHIDGKGEGSLDDMDRKESDSHNSHTNTVNVAPSPRNMDEEGSLDVGIESMVHESLVAEACEDSHRTLTIAHVAAGVVPYRKSDRRDESGAAGLFYRGEIHAQEEVDVKSGHGVHQKILYLCVVF